MWATRGWRRYSDNKWTDALEKRAREFPERYWSAPVEVRGRQGQREREQYAWLRYQPEGCSRARLFAVARRIGPLFPAPFPGPNLPSLKVRAKD